MRITSTAFQPGGAIPEKYSKDGGNISPPLEWTGVPREARSLALIVDDPDAPGGVFAHWLLYGMPIATDRLEEDLPHKATLFSGIHQGLNGYGVLGYGGPQPPSGTHRYIFHLYALDFEPELPPGIDLETLQNAIEGHVIDKAELIGTFAHRDSTMHAR